MRVQFTGLAVGHPDRRGEALAESRHPEGQNIDSGIGWPLKRRGRVIRPAACSAFHGRVHGRTPFSRYSIICAVMRLYTSFLSVVFCIVFFSFKTNFFFAKPATVLKAFSGADMSRARFFRVHRRPLTGSTAGITPVLSGAG